MLLVATDRPETVITFCALLRMGAIPVPVSTMYRGEELGELLRDSRARVVVATPECAEVARAAVRLAVAGEGQRGEHRVYGRRLEKVARAIDVGHGHGRVAAEYTCVGEHLGELIERVRRVSTLRA